MSGVRPIHRQVNHRPHLMAGHSRNSQARHELVVARGHRDSAHLGQNPVAGNLLHLRDPAPVQFLAIGLLQALADGMGGGALRQRGILQKLALLHGGVVNPHHFKDPLGQGPGFVKDHIAGLGQGLQIVGPLDQHAGLAGPPNAREKAQRNADDQGAGAADDQEGQGPVNPVPPCGGQPQAQHPHQGRQNGQGQGAVTHRRGVDPGKLGNEILRPGLPGAGVLHQVQNLGDRGLPKLLGGPNGQQACQVDAAADDLIPLPDVPGQALSGEGTGVQGGDSLHHHAVKGNLLPRLHQDLRSNLHLVRVYLDYSAVPLHVGVIRANVHQLADVPAALPHSIALEPLANLIEEHNRNGLGVVPALFIQGQGNGPYCGHRHEKALVKDLAVANPLPRLEEDIIPDHQVGHQIGQKAHHTGEG